MLRDFSCLIFSLLFFTHCVQEKPDIRVVCETTPNGYHKIKWEIFPPMVGTVKIYESTLPDSFKIYSPVAESDISKGFANVFFTPTAERSYFKLVFNKKHSVITAERIVPMQGLTNFRDLGGYYNSTGNQTRWGKLFRSSTLANATFQDAIVFRNLNIRTVIDFRTEKERYDEPTRRIASNVYNFPLKGSPFNLYFDKVLAGEMRAGDVKVYAQDVFVSLLENNSDYFSKMFDILLDAGNYPVLINCTTGSDRSAIAAALILAALDIDMDQIVSDYMLTNKQTDLSSIIPYGNIFMREPEIQETFTAYYRVHKSTITYTFDKILKEYETIDNYFDTVLELTAKKREKLREIMFY